MGNCISFYLWQHVIFNSKSGIRHQLSSCLLWHVRSISLNQASRAYPVPLTLRRLPCAAYPAPLTLRRLPWAEGVNFLHQQTTPETSLTIKPPSNFPHQQTIPNFPHHQTTRNLPSPPPSPRHESRLRQPIYGPRLTALMNRRYRVSACIVKLAPALFSTCALL